MEAKLAEAAIFAISGSNTSTFTRADSNLAHPAVHKLFERPSSGRRQRPLRPLQSSLTPPIRFTPSYRYTKKRLDESDRLTLESIRHTLIREEDNIIFGLLERAQYRYNANTYDCNAFSMDDWMGLMAHWLSSWLEKLKSFMPRQEDTRVQMSILSSRQNYPNQCFHLYSSHRFYIHVLIQSILTTRSGVCTLEIFFPDW